MTRTVPLACFLLILAACGRADGDYPRLLPTDQVLAQPVLPAHAAPVAESPVAVEATTEAQADALAARAQALQKPVIEPDLRARMGL